MPQSALDTREFTIQVTEHNGVWVAECDAIGLVTEADSFEELTRRAWEIAPELAELNGYPLQPGMLRLRFEHVETAPLPLRA
jgi:hypothetical protein